MNDITLIQNFLEVKNSLINFLMTHIEWHQELISLIDNVKVKINRKMAYVSDKEMDYTYANLKFPGVTWEGLEILEEIKDKLTRETGVEFNSVLLNLYKDGSEEIKWHSDKEEIIGPNPVIACVNLGATRKFWFRSKEYGSEKFYHEVSNGDLLIMGENCQKNYLHAILKEKEITETRISLTYRKVIL